MAKSFAGRRPPLPRPVSPTHLCRRQGVRLSPPKPPHASPNPRLRRDSLHRKAPCPERRSAPATPRSLARSLDRGGDRKRPMRSTVSLARRREKQARSVRPSPWVPRSPCLSRPPSRPRSTTGAALAAQPADPRRSLCSRAVRAVDLNRVQNALRGRDTSNRLKAETRKRRPYGNVQEMSRTHAVGSGGQTSCARPRGQGAMRKAELLFFSTRFARRGRALACGTAVLFDQTSRAGVRRPLLG